jgi:hypothetical protein
MARTKKELKQELKEITDTVDIDMANQVIQMSEELGSFELTQKTLNNIAKWALDGKSQFEIAQNLELSKKEWEYLLKICPTILYVMKHSQAYADIVVAGSLYQTAIGGHTIKKKVPIKVKEYNDYGRVTGEHIEIVEYDEIQKPNPDLLRYLAEHKLSENFGKVKSDNTKTHREIVDAMTDDIGDMILGESDE